MNYKSYTKKKSNFPKYLVVVVITVLLTLFADRTIQKANEIDEFAQKLNFEEVEEIKTEENIIKPSEDYIESVLEERERENVFVLKNLKSRGKK